MQNYTVADADTSPYAFSYFLNGLIGKPHPDYPDRLVTGVVSVQIVVRPYWDHDYQQTLYRCEGIAVVSTDTAK